MNDQPKPWRIAVLLFLFYLIIMTPLMGRKNGYTVDATPAFHLAHSIVDEQVWFPEDAVKQGYVYSIVYIPFYLMGNIIAPVVDTVEPEWIQRKMMCWMNTVFTGLTIAVLSLVLRTLKFSRTSQVWVPLVYGFSTLAFAYARYDYNKCFAALLLVLAFWWWLESRRQQKVSNYFLCGLAVGVLITLRAEMAVVALVLGIAALTPTLSQRERESNDTLSQGERESEPVLSQGEGVLGDGLSQKERREEDTFSQSGVRARLFGQLKFFIAFALPVVFGGAFFVVYNMMYWQGNLTGGYEGGFSSNILPGLIGFLFSPGRSIFIYNPILIFLPFCLYRFYHHQPRVFWVWLCLWGALFLVYSAWLYWWGGWSWGARHLVPLLPLMCVPLAMLLDYGSRIEKIGLAGLAVIGLFIQFLGTMVDFNDVIMMLYNNNVSEEALIWEPIWSQLLHHYLLLEHMTLSRMDYGLIYLWLNWSTVGFVGFVLLWVGLISVIITGFVLEMHHTQSPEEQNL